MGRRWRLGHNPWQDDTPIKARTMTTLRLISSMATKPLLADLVALFQAQAPSVQVQVESVGGVDAAQRVQAGETFDAVVLASDAIDKLIASGHVRSGSRVDLVHSGVAVAVPAGPSAPDISSEDALRQAVLAAPSVGLSTGPSGVQLRQLFERWGILPQIASKLVQAQPGVPVGALLARGEVALGFQQLSEMRGVAGITVLGTMPQAVQIITTFSGSVATSCAQPEAVRPLLAFWASAACRALKEQHGMSAA